MNLIFTMLVAIVAFTTFEPFSKLITDSISPEAITGIRFLLGGIMLFPLAVKDLKKKDIKLSFVDVLIFAGMGILCICISMLALQFAVKVSYSPAVVGIVFSVNSIITIILASIFLKEKITAFKLIATIACVIGIGIMLDVKQLSNIKGVILALIAAFTFSTFTILSKKINVKFSPLITSAVSFSIGGLILSTYVFLNGNALFKPIDFQVVWVIIYLALFVTGIGYIAFFKAMEKGGAIAASLVFFIKPILTPFVTWIVNGVVPDLKVFLALGFILIGSYFGLYKK